MTEVIKLKDILEKIEDTDRVSVSVSKTENAEDGSRIYRTRDVCRWLTKDECFQTLSEKDLSTKVTKLFYHESLRVYSITLSEGN